MSGDHQEHPRRATEGDTVPDLDPVPLEEFVAEEAFDEASEERASAVSQVLRESKPDDGLTVAQWLDAVLEGTSPDEFARLRSSSRTSRSTARCRSTLTMSSSSSGRAASIPTGT